MSSCCDFCGRSACDHDSHIMRSGIDRGSFTTHICIDCAKLVVKSLTIKKPHEFIRETVNAQANMSGFRPPFTSNKS